MSHPLAPALAWHLSGAGVPGGKYGTPSSVRRRRISTLLRNVLGRKEKP